MATIQEVVQQVSGAVLLADLGNGRYMLRVPTDKVMIDPAVSTVVRKVAPDLEVLQNSIARLGPEPINAICVLSQPKNGKFVIGDGEQRYRSLVALKAETCVVQLIESWRTAEDAVAATIQLNSARYNLTDADLLNALAKSTLSVQTFADYTGLSRSSIERLKLICDKVWLTEAALNGYIGYGQAADLVRACEDDAGRLSALQNSFTKAFQEDGRKVMLWRERFKLERGKKWKSEVRQFASYSFYGRRREWGYWKLLLDSGAVENVDGAMSIIFPGDESSQHGLRGVHIEEDEHEWAQRFAMSNLEGAKWNEISLEDHNRLIEQWELIGQRVRAAYVRRMESSSSSTNAVPQPQHADEAAAVHAAQS
jgi:hypothetical protein